MSESNEFLLEMGRRIHDRRKELNLSQEQLAEKAGISPQIISTAERGVKALRPENLYKISIALSVSSDYLLSGNYADGEIADVTNRLKLLSPEVYKWITRYPGIQTGSSVDAE